MKTITKFALLNTAEQHINMPADMFPLSIQIEESYGYSTPYLHVLGDTLGQWRDYKITAYKIDDNVPHSPGHFLGTLIVSGVILHFFKE